MSRYNRPYSIKSLLVWAIMSITSATALVISGFMLYSYFDFSKREFIAEARIYASLVGQIAENSVIFSDDRTLEEQLKILQEHPLVLNAHIYHKTVDGQLELLSTFNNADPVVDILARQDQLTKPVLLDDTVEILLPIVSKGNNIGATYIRFDASEFTSIQTSALLSAALILLLTFAFCYVIALKVQRIVAKPVNSLVRLLAKTARQRDFSLRAQPSELLEFDTLAESLNEMLSRSQDYIRQRDNAEQAQFQLRSSLEEKVKQRTRALKEANQELIQTLEKLHQFQRQMVENEKMASLGDMVAGVAHEVNTPIGLGVTASTMMIDRVDQLTEAFNNKTLKASTMAKFLDESKENLGIVYRNLNRAAELISSFKQVAVDQTTEIARTFSFPQLLDEILLSLRPKMKKYNHHIHLDCEDDLLIEAKAGPINQIMINLIMNSIIHGFEDEHEGEIFIEVSMLANDQLHMVYKDNGKGMSADIRERIFDPFVTTKRGQGGSGLGMHLVYNLVTQSLGGTISVQSAEQQGTEFVVTFPVKRVDSLSD